MPSHTFDRSLYSRLSQPAKPVLRQPPVVGNSQNLKPARIFPVNGWIAEIFAGELCEYLVPVRPASLLVTCQSIRPGSQTPLSRQRPSLEPSIHSIRLTQETRLPLPGEKNNSFDQCSSLAQNLIAGDSLDRAVVEFHCSALGFN